MYILEQMEKCVHTNIFVDELVQARLWERELLFPEDFQVEQTRWEVLVLAWLAILVLVAR